MHSELSIPYSVFIQKNSLQNIHILKISVTDFGMLVDDLVYTMDIFRSGPILPFIRFVFNFYLFTLLLRVTVGNTNTVQCVKSIKTVKI